MPRALSTDLRRRVLDDYRNRLSAREVSKRYHVSIPCVYRWAAIESATGSLKPLYRSGGRASIPDDAKFLRFMEGHAHSTLLQMQAAWEGPVSIHALSRKLKKLGLTRKKRPSDTSSETT